MDAPNTSTTPKEALAVKELVEHFSKLSCALRQMLERRAGMPFTAGGAGAPPKSL